MKLEYVWLMLIVICGYFGISFDTIMRRDFDISFLNPVRNYKQWNRLNWFGVGTTTILLNIICLPYAIIYWVYKLIKLLFTVGRKSN